MISPADNGMDTAVCSHSMSTANLRTPDSSNGWNSAGPGSSLGDAGSLVTGVRETTRIRMSVGLEDVDDILRDLEQALS